MITEVIDFLRGMYRSYFRRESRNISSLMDNPDILDWIKKDNNHYVGQHISGFLKLTVHGINMCEENRFVDFEVFEENQQHRKHIFEIFFLSDSFSLKCEEADFKQHFDHQNEQLLLNWKFLRDLGCFEDTGKPTIKISQLGIDYWKSEVEKMKFFGLV